MSCSTLAIPYPGARSLTTSFSGLPVQTSWCRVPSDGQNPFARSCRKRTSHGELIVVMIEMHDVVGATDAGGRPNGRGSEPRQRGLGSGSPTSPTMT